MGVTGIILSGGKSSRMGRDKGLLELGGRKLVEIAAANLSKICDSILISTNSEVYSDFGFEIAGDIHKNIGPLGGIYSSLSRSNSEYNLILSVDLPFVNVGLLNYLVDQSHDFQIAVPYTHDGYYEPLCACYHQSVLPVVEECIKQNQYKLQSLINRCNINRLDINSQLPFYHSDLFYNVNSLTDLELAQKIFNTRS